MNPGIDGTVQPMTQQTPLPFPRPSGRRTPTRLRGVWKLVLAAVAWSLLVFASLWTQRGQLDRTAESLARIDAIANLKKDMSIRKWASSLGGVYIEEAKVPNVDALSEAERLRATRVDGQPVTLVNLTPIHILLAIQAVGNQDFGNKERLTSLQLHNRANEPDDWEVKALKTLESGADMVTESVPRKGSHGLMRVMIPMRMEKECLECHRDTLVPVGGLRGGAATTVNLNAYRAAQEPTWQSIQYWHLGIWLLGLTLMYTVWSYSGRRALEQAKQEEARQENETAFSAMAEGAIITEADGRIRWVNDAFCRIYGYSRDEVIGQTPRILKSGRHDQAFYQDFWRQLTTVGRWRGELWNRRKSGEVFPEEISIQALPGSDGKPVRYISIFSDITERKRNEAKLKESEAQLRELAEFLRRAREEERSRIARELHDELGQSLTALRIDLNWLRSRGGPLTAAMRERLQAALSLVERTVDAVRRISEDLRPRMLDDLGLAAAIEHHVSQFSQRSGIPCSLTMNREEFEVDSRCATAVFRVVQEALTNVARHADAANVAVRIEETADGIRLSVRDDGRGFAEQGGGKTFGLIGMRERVAALGGRIEIESVPEQGTAIEAWIPREETPS
jgi:hypothetical protein